MAIPLIYHRWGPLTTDGTDSKLTHVINGSITGIRFGSSQNEVRVESRVSPPERSGRIHEWGEVRGLVETKRFANTFTICNRPTIGRIMMKPRIAKVESRVSPPERSGRIHEWGEVRGLVETLTKRRRHCFTLFEELFNQAVICTLSADQEEMMRSIWGKEVIVIGDIVREKISGRPVAVPVVESVEHLQPVPPGHYQRARGIVDFQGQRPEALLRKLRDAE